MDISLAFNDIQTVAKDFQQTYGGNYQLASRETVLLMPAVIGQGYLRGINLREGLDLFIYEYDLNCNLILDFQKLSLDNSFVNLSFCVSGHCSGSMPGIKDKIHVSSWQTTFSTVPYATGIIELLADRKICVVELVMAPRFAMTLLERELNAMPGDWQQALKTLASKPFYSLTSISQEVSQILQRMLRCPYQGTLRQLYLEGKSLELIALYFSELTAPSDVQTVTIKRKDLDSLHQAKSILLQKMDDPPSLSELAKQVGLSERKLQKGFQELFGTTVFGVLHDYRMEQARQLLETEQMTVGAISTAVGISHRGYFATAFKRKFGTTPRDYLKRLSN
ncbi:MAG: AraC family transcriptional regulator [Cyanobacteria bacterium P01_H01_bin.105]